MSNLVKTAFLSVKWNPNFQTFRFRRVNVQRPREPHYERAKVLALLRPIFPEPETARLPPSMTCKRKQEMEEKTVRIDNPFERILAKEVLAWFNQSKLVAIFHMNPISGEDKFQVTVNLKKEGMHLKVYSHHTVRMALENTHYSPVLQLFKAHSGIVFSEEPQVAKLMKIVKRTPQLVLMAGIVENRLLSSSQLSAYSRLKDRTTARAQLVSTLNTAGSTLLSALSQHQRTLVSQLEQYVRIKSENGEKT